MQVQKYSNETYLNPAYYALENLYVVTVAPPPRAGSSPPARRFVAELFKRSWDKRDTPCLYAGTSQGGAAIDYGRGYDSVIEGNYRDYKMANRFSTDFNYKMFDDNKC